jgi:hypothetical protein
MNYALLSVSSSGVTSLALSTGLIFKLFSAIIHTLLKCCNALCQLHPLKNLFCRDQIEQAQQRQLAKFPLGQRFE